MKKTLESSERFFGHDTVKLVFRDKTVFIEIGSFDHLLEVVVIDVFSQLSDYFSKVGD